MREGGRRRRGGGDARNLATTPTEPGGQSDVPVSCHDGIQGGPPGASLLRPPQGRRARGWPRLEERLAGMLVRATFVPSDDWLPAVELHLQEIWSLACLALEPFLFGV